MTIPFASCSLLAAVSGADPRINEGEWGAFLHLPNDQFYGLNMIRSEIVRDTEAKTGRNAGISPQPINWRIVSPDVLTLTLVDLPVLTRTPVATNSMTSRNRFVKCSSNIFTSPPA